jgi:uncharacterized protein YdaU (DUF1376 family)
MSVLIPQYAGVFFGGYFMKYYQYNIGDFDKATRHLSRIERSVYRDLLDLYYTTESPLSVDMAFLCRKIIALSNEESTAVEQVLNEFFNETENGWYHDRCEKEIAVYRSHISQRAMAGKASAEAKRLKTQQMINGCSTSVELALSESCSSVSVSLNETSTNHKPITNNQEPITKNQEEKKKATYVACPPDVSEQVWSDWQQLRKQKKAAVTTTVLDAARKESQKAGMTLEAFLQVWCLRGSQGLQASWLTPDELGKPNLNKQEALEASNRAVAQRYLESDGYTL